MKFYAWATNSLEIEQKLLSLMEELFEIEKDDKSNFEITIQVEPVKKEN